MRNRPISSFWVICGLAGISLAVAMAEQSISLSPYEAPAQQEIIFTDFDPPNPVRPVQTSQASVTIFNGSPQPLEITLTDANGQRTLLRFPPCPSCPTYLPGQEPPDCFAESVQQSYVLPVGEYEAQAVWQGSARGFRSRWVMASGWDHQQCLFITYDPSMVN